MEPEPISSCQPNDYADIVPPTHPISRIRPTLIRTTMLHPNAAQWRRNSLVLQADSSQRFLIESVVGGVGCQRQARDENAASEPQCNLATG